MRLLGKQQYVTVPTNWTCPNCGTPMECDHTGYSCPDCGATYRDVNAIVEAANRVYTGAELDDYMKARNTRVWGKP